VDAWTDFTCPHSFLTSLYLRTLRDEMPLAIRWRSMLVRPPGLPPLPPLLRANAEKARAEASDRAKKEFGLELRPAPLEIDALPAHLGFKHAERAGCGDECHDALMSAYWLGGARLDARRAVELVLRSSKPGLSPVPWDDPALAESVDADLVLAQSLDLYSVPALRLGDTMLVHGAQPYDRLREAARLAADALAHPGERTEVQRYRTPPPRGGFGARPS
jgi:predicted DsbA family dithiol-disulfide isomerase